MWSKMPPVNIMVVLMLSSPVLAGPYYYSAPWQPPSQLNSFQQLPQATQQYKPAAVTQGSYQPPSKVYHFVVTYENPPAYIQQKPATYQNPPAYNQPKPAAYKNSLANDQQKPVIYQNSPTYDQQKPVTYQKTIYIPNNYNHQTYQQMYQHPNVQLTRRSDKTYVPSQYVSMQQVSPYYAMPSRSYAQPFSKPYTSYDAPITPNQIQNTQAQPRSIKSEYQSFLHEIAPQNGVNFDLQGQVKRQNHSKDIVNPAVLDPEILKVLEDLLFKEESSRNDEELKKVETIGVPFSSYGVPINQRKVVGVALEPSIRSLSLGEITL